MKIDYGTFGNDKAAQVLVDILNKANDRVLTSKISKFIQSFDLLIWPISRFKDKKYKNRMYQILFREAHFRANNLLKTISNKTALTHATTHVTTKLRNTLLRDTK